MPIITLTTDFGLTDPYVGQVKGVLLTLCPQAQLVDLSHQIPAHDLRRAAVILSTSAPHFPAETIHLAVVDPGVGTARRAIIVQADGRFFIAPDNGLLTNTIKTAAKAKCRVILNQELLSPRISPTFHGRDVFAWAAGRLASGVSPVQLGPRIKDPLLLDWPVPRIKNGRILGQVLFADRFGNLVTDIPADLILKIPAPKSPRIRIGDLTLNGLHLTYAEVPEGKPLALIGSFDLLEIALNQGRADEVLGLGPGTEVEVRL